MPGGLEALMRRNHDLAVLAQRILCDRLGLQPVGVESMLGSMAAVHLPDNPAAFDSQGNPVPGEEYRLNNELFANHHIEVPAFFWPAAPRDALARLRPGIQPFGTVRATGRSLEESGRRPRLRTSVQLGSS